MFIGDANTVVGNCLSDNGQYGFNAYEGEGVRRVVFRGNEVTGDDTADGSALRNPGCGCTGGGKFWETADADVIGNWIHNNRGSGMWADTNNKVSCSRATRWPATTRRG